MVGNNKLVSIKRVDFMELNPEILRHEKQTELRLIDPQKKLPAQSVFIKNKTEAEKVVVEYEGKYNIYYGINERKENGTTAEDVIAVRTIVVDIDPIRIGASKDEATTEQELAKAKEVCDKVVEWVEESGFQKPAIAMSGNGYQLWFSIPTIPLEEWNRYIIEEKVKLFNKKIIEKFSTKEVKIDNIGDLPRIIKVIGTLSIKGSNTPERPHRKSYWCYLPDKIVEDQRLRDLILLLQTPEKKTEKAQENTGVAKDLEEFLAERRKKDLVLDKFLNGDTSSTDGDRSRAEFGLVSKLIFYNLSKEQILKVMQANPLGKWTTDTENYRERTYQTALKEETKRWTDKKTEDFLGLKVLNRIPKKYGERAGSVAVEYVYHENGVKKITHKWVKIKKDDDTDDFVDIITQEDMLTGKLIVKSRIEFEESEEQEYNWHIEFNGEQLNGSLEEIVEELISYGAITCTKEEFRQIFSHIVVNTVVETKKVYPAVGIYLLPHKDNEVVFADGKDTVKPSNDSQKNYLSNYETAKLQHSFTEEEIKETLQACVDYIDAMPLCNRLPVLVANGYATIAPICYELKKTMLGIFPFLYLYGEASSSKTQTADVCFTYRYGQKEHLNGEAIDTPFRLAMEFSSSTFPVAIDEAENVFVKNMEIFKASATSLLATKRGNKDKTMSSYSAFCPFVFTSNLPAITAEEDTQGAISERVLVLEMGKGSDFKRIEYMKASDILASKGFLVGMKTVQKLIFLLKNKGKQQIVEEIREIAHEINKYEPMGIRRAISIAEIVYGVRLFIEILTEYGITPKNIDIKNQTELTQKIVDKISAQTKTSDVQFVMNIMQFAESMADRNKGQDAEINGIYRNSKGNLVLHGVMLNSYKKFYNLKDLACKDLKSLSNEFKRLGMNLNPTAHKTTATGKETLWGLEVDIADYRNHLEDYLNPKPKTLKTDYTKS